MNVLQRLPRLLSPRKCVLCRELLPSNSSAMLCEACARTVREQYRNTAPVTVRGADGADAPLLYTGRAANAMKRYKFGGETALCRWFSAQCVVCLSRHMEVWRPELVTCVPLGFLRWWKRGFNQSGAVAGEIGKALELPFEPVLGKRPHRGRQSQRNAEERRRAAKGLFFVRPGCSVAGKRIVLVDDIVTSGETAADAVRALREAGASAVYVLAVMRTPCRRKGGGYPDEIQ